MTTATQLRQLLLEAPDLRVIDVRSGAEFESAHIPGSYNVPLDTLREHAGDLAGLDLPVILVCQSGARASQAETTLGAAGKSGVSVLEGGMVAWEQAGGDVIRGAQKWSLERQVRLVAGSLVVTGIVASTVVPRAKWLAGLIGAGLTFSAVSNTCTMGDLLSRLPYNRGAGCDVDDVVARMRTAA